MRTERQLAMASREESPIRLRIIVSGAIGAAGLTAAMIASGAPPQKGVNAEFARNAQMMLDEGRKTFNYGTFWSDVLQLHRWPGPWRAWRDADDIGTDNLSLSSVRFTPDS
jgi:hypothetical protein